MQLNRNSQHGFTLIEMIVVMVITGILGGMIALLIKGPVQGYVDSARRADMTDVADTVLSRIIRDLRIALPNSVRVSNATGNATCNGTEICFFEFIPTSGGGRYSEITSGVGYFAVLGPMPDFYSSSSIVIDNASASGTYSAYNGYSVVTGLSSSVPSTINFTSGSFSSVSPGDRFQIISTPVTYVCDPAVGTLTRYWGYAVQAAQPHTVATLNGLAGEQNSKLATKVSACNFNYLPTGSGLVTLYLAITESGESVNLYDTANVANLP